MFYTQALRDLPLPSPAALDAVGALAYMLLMVPQADLLASLSRASLALLAATSGCGAKEAAPIPAVGRSFERSNHPQFFLFIPPKRAPDKRRHTCQEKPTRKKQKRVYVSCFHDFSPCFTLLQTHPRGNVRLSVMT